MPDENNASCKKYINQFACLEIMRKYPYLFSVFCKMSRPLSSQVPILPPRDKKRYHITYLHKLSNNSVCSKSGNVEICNFSYYFLKH